jgi:hypothetical protein
LAGSGAWAGARRIGSCVDKGSSLVAEIINLGTAGAAGEFPFAAVQRGVSAPLHLRGNEVADEAGESLWHLIGKRHHAS